LRHRASDCAGLLSCMLSQMKDQRQQTSRPSLRSMPCVSVATLTLAIAYSPAHAQDVRGMQICTVEKQMERRTSCLQANVEFLQDALLKLGRETQAKLDADGKALAAARAEIGALQATVKKLESELVKLQTKPSPASKK
jgi:hypothetical protein